MSACRACSTCSPKSRCRRRSSSRAGWPSTTRTWDLTPITLDLVRQHGMIYSSNLMDDVFPYVHPGTSIVELPVQWTLDDAPYWLFHPTFMPRPLQSPEVVYGIWRDEFLGAYEWGGLFNLTCHPQVIGHPSRLLCLRQLIRFIKGHDGVWWATGREVAEHWLARDRDVKR